MVKRKKPGNGLFSFQGREMEDYHLSIRSIFASAFNLVT